MSSVSPRFYDFGPFRVDLTEHLLLRGGETVPLTPKAFETLVHLVRNNGRIVVKEELLKMVWPETYVEEATLAQNVFTLRKALGGSEGEQYIQTIPRRGYRFVATVTEVMDEPAVLLAAQAPAAPSGTPRRVLIANERKAFSLAVLPLFNSSGDPDAEYLTDGITESIVNTLSLLPELKIKACSTVLPFKGLEMDPQAIGRKLAVDSVLVGRIVGLSENLLIRMELVDVNDGWQIWGEEYNQGLSEIHHFQAAVAKDISQKLSLKLAEEDWRRVLKPRAHKAEAYESYLKGRHFLNKRTKQGYEKAIECFEQAIEIDGSFALAYCGLADSYIRYDFYGITAPWQTITKARAATARSIELDPTLAESHTSLAAIKLIYDRDVSGAEREFKLALRLNLNYPHAHDGYAHCLLEMNQIDDSLTECRTALELDPYDLEINQHLGWYYLYARQPDLAIDQLMKTLEMGADSYRARILLGIAYAQKKLFSQAIAEFIRAGEVEKTPVLSGFLGYAYAIAGRKEAGETLDELLEQSKYSYVPPYSIALVYTGLGKRDEALEWLQKAFVEHSRWHGWLTITPELDSLRSDPRFTELLEHRFNRAQINSTDATD
jgi:DNA-binding winged helix-turn-helix (wHTH) protein/tetratricopeptide (TPR) repeat protein